ncbi:MAG: preprotein translocase subunit SecD [Alteromonas naphthalenivorans]|jgi:preprotein translocase subunit SecD
MASLAGRTTAYGFIFWLALAGVGSYFVLPLHKHLKLGIDLVGGFYITLQVQTEEAVKLELQQRLQGATKRLSDNGIDVASHKIEKQDIVLTFETLKDVQQAAKYLKSHSSEMTIQTEGTHVKMHLPDHIVQDIKKWSVESNIEVLRKRLDKTGVSEVSISRQGERNIIIELPNVDDPARAKEMIGRAAHLEIKKVEKSAPTEEDLLDDFDGVLPDGMVIVPSEEQKNGEPREHYLVPDYTDLTGKELKNAEPSLGGMSGTDPVVKFEFKPDGGDRFYDLTSKSHGKQIAVIIDNEVISAPRVESTIHSTGIITGNFTWESAQDLATALKSGSFVAPVTFEEERRIGPSLGRESIKQGITSCLIGLALLFFFSLFYYKVSGLFAFIALIYNLILVVFCLAWVQATLTLPGIAGMVLTIGMAIDASILIYEKIRELLATGVTFRKAVDEGFSDAMVVILDANITTLLMGIVLYKFGTGPIQGFAVTMMFGILSTLATGLFFLRSLFDVALSTGVKRISI